MLEGVVRAALCTMLLAFVVQFGLWTLRVRHPKLQLSAWTAVLVASVAVPALQRVIPADVPTMLSRSFSPPPIINPGMQTRPLPLPAFSPAISASGAASARASVPHLVVGWGRWLTWGYILVAALLFARLALGLGSCWRMLRATHPVGADWAAGQRLRTSTWIGAPVAVGSNVLLPAEYVNWDAGRRQAVLAHEGAHVARGDFYVQLLSQVNRSIFWFSPLSWWLHRRLIALAELASDDAAIEALGDRRGYAAILRDFARLPRTLSIGVAMASPATDGPRILRILAEAAPPGRVSSPRRTIIALGSSSVATIAPDRDRNG